MTTIECEDVCSTTADVGLATSTPHVIQEYWPSSLTKERTTVSRDICERRDKKGRERKFMNMYVCKNEGRTTTLIIIYCVFSHVVGRPSCLQTTTASFLSQKSSHIVPHTLFWQYSTRPSEVELPPTNLTSPFWHKPVYNRTVWIDQLSVYSATIQLRVLYYNDFFEVRTIKFLSSDSLALRQATPASPVCLQSRVLVSWGQLSSDDSEPLQRRSSMAMGTLPWPKNAFLNGITTG